MLEIINRQRQVRIQSTAWRDLGERALKALHRQHRSATIVFVGDAAIRKLNQQFRGRNSATDVLSFPSAPERFETEDRDSLGEIVISVQTAVRQAKENKLSFTNEVQQLILHGLLHLCGYDHENDDGEMNRLELRLRQKLGI